MKLIPTIGMCVALSGSMFHPTALPAEEVAEPVSDRQIVTTVSENNFDFNDYAYWKKQGYSSIPEYNKALEDMHNEASGKADKAIALYSLSDEDKEKLYLYEKKMANAECIDIYNKYSDLFDELVDEYKSSQNVAYSYSNGGGLTKSAGVNYFNGRRETWYSSRVLYHYRTGEWTPDANGVYRDKDGYVVVAASDLPQGATVNTSHGMGKVYDCGCAPGTTDIYVNW